MDLSPNWCHLCLRMWLAIVVTPDMRWMVQTADLVLVREHGMATSLLVCLLVGKYFIKCDFKFLAYDGVDFRRPS